MTPTRSESPARPAFFDPTRCRQVADGRGIVLMSQHYAVLSVRLAEEAEFLPGVEILRRTVETTLLGILRDLIQEGGLEGRDARAELCRSYWAACGMGDLRIDRCDPEGGTAEMRRSHVDEGWLRLWGRRDRPVNLFTQGFLAAVWSAVGDEPTGTYQVREVQSLVSGASSSVFTVERRK